MSIGLLKYTLITLHLDQRLLMKRVFSLFFCALSAFSFNADAQYRKIVSIAGTGGMGGYGGDGYTATAGTLNGPQNIALDKVGNVYIVDYYNFRVRKIKKSDNTIVTFAGNGLTGYTGDGTAATNAKMNPKGVACDFRGNVYISDNVHNVIRKVNNLNIISTYAGTGSAGYFGDGGSALSAQFNTPFGMACDKKGNLYIADAGNHVVRMIDTFGVISTVAGDGTPGYSGDGFSATTAQLDSPFAVAVAPSGSIVIADHNNNVVRMVDPSGVISTIAGDGAFAYSGDGGLGINASFNYPTGVAVDTAGNVFISDSYNNVIRELDILGTINTVVGNGAPGFGGDLGGPLGANLFHPYGIAVDTFGSFFIADANNQRIRKVYTTTVGVGNDPEADQPDVFPNPFDSRITVSELHKNDKVCMYDVTGRAVTATWTVIADGEQSFDIEGLARGVYMLHISDAEGNNRATIKMVK